MQKQNLKNLKRAAGENQAEGRVTMSISVENISTLENSSSKVSMTLRKNGFSEKKLFCATVTRNVANFRNILSEIAEDNKGMDPFMLQFAAILIQKKILKLLEQGKAVNVLDLGTLYIAAKCSAQTKSEAAANAEFCIKFTPTALTEKAIGSLSLDKVVFADSSPEITGIETLSEAEDKSKLAAGQPAKITGARLKIGGEESGVFFAPCDESGGIETDETLWKQVPASQLFRNKPTELNFFVPTLDEGFFRVVLRTRYLSSTTVRKDLLETVSDVVAVAAKAV